MSKSFLHFDSYFSLALGPWDRSRGVMDQGLVRRDGRVMDWGLVRRFDELIRITIGVTGA